MRPFFRVQIQTHAARRNTKISRPHGRDFEQARKLETRSETHNPSQPMKANHHTHASTCATSHARNTSSMRFLTKLLPAFTVSLFVLLFTVAPKAEAGLLDTVKKARDARNAANDAKQEADAVAKDTGITTTGTTTKLTTTATTAAVATSGTTTVAPQGTDNWYTPEALARRVCAANGCSPAKSAEHFKKIMKSYENLFEDARSRSGAQGTDASNHKAAMDILMEGLGKGSGGHDPKKLAAAHVFDRPATENTQAK